MNSVIWNGEAQTPAIIWKLLMTPAMQSLIALSRLDFVDSNYWWLWENILNIADKYSRDDFDSKTGLLISHWNRTISWEYLTRIKERWFINDIIILAWEIDSWDEVRELCSVWLLHSESVRYLYARMVELWKMTHNDLTMADGKIMDYRWREMEMFMQFGSPMFSFNSFNNRVFDTLLWKDVSDQNLELFFDGWNYTDDHKELIRRKLVCWDNGFYTIDWPDNFQMHVSSHIKNFVSWTTLIPQLQDFKRVLDAITEMWIIDSWEVLRFLQGVLWYNNWLYLFEWPSWKLIVFVIWKEYKFVEYSEEMLDKYPIEELLVRSISYTVSHGRQDWDIEEVQK